MGDNMKPKKEIQEVVEENDDGITGDLFGDLAKKFNKAEKDRQVKNEGNLQKNFIRIL